MTELVECVGCEAEIEVLVTRHPDKDEVRLEGSCGFCGSRVDHVKAKGDLGPGPERGHPGN